MSALLLIRVVLLRLSDRRFLVPDKLPATPPHIVNGRVVIGCSLAVIEEEEEEPSPFSQAAMTLSKKYAPRTSLCIAGI